MKFISTLLILAHLLVLPALGSTPHRRALSAAQPDGSSLALTLTANGRYCVWATADGLAVLPDADGVYRYAVIKDGNPAPSAVAAHEAALRSADESAWVKENALTAPRIAALLDQLNPAPSLLPLTRGVSSTDDGLGEYGKSGAGTVKSIGSPVIPVVMVNFSDVALQDSVTPAKLSRFFNEEGYADESLASASVRDFFVDQSQGLFSPTFEIAAVVTVPETRSYYGKDADNGSLDPNINTFIADALAEAEQTVDFSQWADEKGQVPLVAVYFAGPGEQSSFEEGYTDYIWARYSATKFTLTDGTVVNSYLVANELLQDYTGTAQNPVIVDTHLDGIGLFVHEFGHALGLPDFYYTGSDASIKASLNTMDYWSVMDYGEYYMNGYLPIGYNAYERSNMGWLKVEELTEPQHAALYPFGREDEGATAYLLRNPADEREYYLLENRQPSRFFPKRMGQGMLITHVDYLYVSWAANRVNNDPDHQRMTYVPADNVKDGATISTTMAALFNGYKGDLFPGTEGVTSFTNETTPAATLFNGESGYLSLPLYNIALSADSVITFSFIDPEATDISNAVAPSSASAHGTAYTLTGQPVSDLQSAPRGIYILPGGRKVVKK